MNLFRHFAKNQSKVRIENWILTVRNINYLKIALNWEKDPLITDQSVHDFDYLEDLNERRIRDMEVVLSACANNNNHNVQILEIGTSKGRTTRMMSENAPEANICTINIPPDQIESGGELVTYAPSIEEIGEEYKSAGRTNILQILENTATWIPDFDHLDIVFIDGCHDAEFVYNDTKKILPFCSPGSIIMWHDFNPQLRNVYPWIDQVLKGVEQLYYEGILSDKILHLQDSWVGLYKVSK